jgi:hypothetical protein
MALLQFPLLRRAAVFSVLPFFLPVCRYATLRDPKHRCEILPQARTETVRRAAHNRAEARPEAARESISDEHGVLSVPAHRFIR